MVYIKQVDAGKYYDFYKIFKDNGEEYSERVFNSSGDAYRQAEADGQKDIRSLCHDCGRIISEAEDFNGWCKECFAKETSRYKRAMAQQDGLEGLSDAELEMVA